METDRIRLNDVGDTDNDGEGNLRPTPLRFEGLLRSGSVLSLTLGGAGDRPNDDESTAGGDSDGAPPVPPNAHCCSTSPSSSSFSEL